MDINESIVPMYIYAPDYLLLGELYEKCLTFKCKSEPTLSSFLRITDHFVILILCLLCISQSCMLSLHVCADIFRLHAFSVREEM